MEAPFSVSKNSLFFRGFGRRAEDGCWGQPAYATCSHRVLSRQALLTTTFHCYRCLVDMVDMLGRFWKIEYVLNCFNEFDGWCWQVLFEHKTCCRMLQAHFRDFSWFHEVHHTFEGWQILQTIVTKWKRKCRECRPWFIWASTFLSRGTTEELKLIPSHAQFFLQVGQCQLNGSFVWALWSKGRKTLWYWGSDEQSQGWWTFLLNQKP